MLKKLPQVRGRYTENAPLARLTTIKVGGPADVMFEPVDLADLQVFLKGLPEDIPYIVIGEGSNLMLRDGGIRGVVIRMDKALNDVQVNGLEITAGAGATGGKVARAAREHSLKGAEFLCGIPGSVGGALKMNAGAYGHETVDILKEVQIVTQKGELQTLSPKALNFAYRHSELPKGALFVGATFKLEQGDKEEIRNRMREINKNRATSQPLNMPSSGSWFKNVMLEDGTKKHAWQVVSEAGCRGMRVGDAQVSVKHCNFFVNLGEATAKDMQTLTEHVEAQVLERLGVQLEREVRFVGED
ncbi:MAG: UDP-N-acetylenolpyruvoylglucosamine reductase [Magnetococcales bacterium]|nr:UDP-N-acetylenolpyruvoylglucosamine reductase [Magnetococcales bacterium]